ncbi:hypothetical protein ETAA8_20880 [Anatilimnocola aggregata]|uniref:Planctomycete cytochrome C n=1 Tax=Anatilimnocola aggregata TaxID=2528021 RepID=A0A517Y9U8_9BACT|nr:DUF1592 domain-containing protein [Anatilimnocola aggregata]QDU27004.1 hypothetical protein ETAA8_20880 [Anatilimnocola aggregata]
MSNRHLFVAALVLCCFDIGASTAADPASEKLLAEVRPVLQKHCLGCHSGTEPKGELRLDQLGTDLTAKETREAWQNVHEQLRIGAMPPKEKPRPTKEELTQLTTWIDARLAAAEERKRAATGRVVLRRMNRIEYENTVRDLLGIETPLRELLPLDTSAAGFDNVGEALHTSSFLLDRYLEAADTAINQAISNRPQPPTLVKKRLSLQDSHQVKNTTEKVFRKREDGSVVLFCSSLWQSVGLSHFYPQDRGRYRFRLSASAIQNKAEPVTFRILSGAGGMGGPKAHLVGYFDVRDEEPRVIEFVDHMEPRTSITILPYGLPSAQAINKIGADVYDGPGLAIDWVDVEGPLHETWPPESHQRLFGDMKQGSFPIYNQRDRVEVISEQPLVDAERIVKKFARRAFRRSVTDEELKPFLALFSASLDEKQTFEQAIRVALAAIMVSPEFLFLKEEPGQLNDFALASRLSYFLWSSMPDEELLSLAEQGLLKKSGRVGERERESKDVLGDQVERLLRHPKSHAFTENFVGQWLNLREIDATNPSHILYPEMDDMLKASMVRETELFFAEVLSNNRPLTNFVSSDFSMLNGRLARHYGIPGVAGWEFQKVQLPADSHRGGLLTMASVLKVTANGTHTSPVVRGAFVLDRILGTPPPKPPENIAGLEPDIRGATTIRQQLAKHRQLDSCASCHVQIDPPGFALESFDVIGGYREFYRTSGSGKAVMIDGKRMPYLQGPPIDPADKLADGRAFANIDEFKQLLLTDKDQLTRALATKLITYGTGAPPETLDAPQLEQIVSRVKAKEYGFRDLIHAIVASELFQQK